MDVHPLKRETGLPGEPEVVDRERVVGGDRVHLRHVYPGGVESGLRSRDRRLWHLRTADTGEPAAEDPGDAATFGQLTGSLLPGHHHSRGAVGRMCLRPVRHHPTGITGSSLARPSAVVSWTPTSSSTSIDSRRPGTSTATMNLRWKDRSSARAVRYCS